MELNEIGASTRTGHGMDIRDGKTISVGCGISTESKGTKKGRHEEME